MQKQKIKKIATKFLYLGLFSFVLFSSGNTVQAVENCENGKYDNLGICTLVSKGFYAENSIKIECQNLQTDEEWDYPENLLFQNTSDDCIKKCREGFYYNSNNICYKITDENSTKKIFNQFVNIVSDELINEKYIYNENNKLINTDLTNQAFLQNLFNSNDSYELLLEDKYFSKFKNGMFLFPYKDLKEKLKDNIEDENIINFLSEYTSHTGNETYSSGDSNIDKAIRIAIISKLKDKINSLNSDISDNFLLDGLGDDEDAKESIMSDILNKTTAQYSGTGNILPIPVKNVLSFLSKQDDTAKLEQAKGFATVLFSNGTGTGNSLIFSNSIITLFDINLNSEEGIVLQNNLLNFNQMTDDNMNFCFAEIDDMIKSKENLVNYSKGLTVSAVNLRESIDSLDLSTGAYLASATGSIKKRIGLFDDKIAKMFVDYNALNLIQDSLDGAGYIKGCEPGTGLLLNGEKFAFDGEDFTIPCSKVEFRKLIDKKRRAIIGTLKFTNEQYKKDVNEFIVNSFSTAYKRNALIDGNGYAKCKQGSVDLGDGCIDVKKVKIGGVAYGTNSGPINLDPYDCKNINDKKLYRDCVENNDDGPGGLRLVSENGRVKLEGTIYSPEIGHINFGGIDININPGLGDTN